MTTIRALALCAAMAAACSHHQDGLQLRYKFNPAQTDRYKIELTVQTTTSDQPVGTKTPIIRGGGNSVVKVDKIEPDGSAEITSTMEDFRVGGRPTIDSAQTVKFVLSPTGVATASGAPKPADKGQKSVDPRILARLSTILPPGPVKPGDSWKNQVPDPLTGGGAVEVTARFFRMENVDGIETARIHQSMEMPMVLELPQPGSRTPVKVSGKVTISAAIHFDPAAGKVVRSSVSGHGVLRAAAPEGAPADSPEPPSLDFKVDVIANLVH